MEKFPPLKSGSCARCGIPVKPKFMFCFACKQKPPLSREYPETASDPPPIPTWKKQHRPLYNPDAQP